MHLLVLGGTWFVGRAIVEAARLRGHSVSVFNRSQTEAKLPSGIEVLRGDREDRDALRALAATGPWDGVVDVHGVVPAVVRDAARALAPVASHYVFISTVSTYKEWPAQPVIEESLVHEDDPDARPKSWKWGTGVYGPLKAGAEAAILREFGAEHTLILRPAAIVGRYEYSGRLPWWLERAARGGQILAPAPADATVRPLDVRDLADFLLRQIEQHISGIFNLAGPASTFADLIRTCLAVTAGTGEPMWVDGDWLAAQGVRQWTEIPLWRLAPGTWEVDTTKAKAAGLTWRPFDDTAADCWAWLSAGGRPVDSERQALHGLSPERETELLQAWSLTTQQEGLSGSAG